jgi:hypothetical protein
MNTTLRSNSRVVAALVAGRSRAADEAFGLVEVQGGYGHAAAGCQLADGELSRRTG